ncbi:MAG: hypothetical protein R3240_09130 [Gammaproteobacteria bacterium]|nr:hypothetical protein [Gammaproteobacteria bacterium]
MQRFTLIDSGQVLNASEALTFPVRRRKYLSGTLQMQRSEKALDQNEVHQRWLNNEPILLPGAVSSQLAAVAADIETSKALYEGVLDGQELDELLSGGNYPQQLAPEFELLSARYDAADEQEICSIDFDAHADGELIEDIWLRAAWLSYDERDASLRFRFSFGMEGYEDVSQDLQRQQLAAELEERIFPESRILSHNESLHDLLGQIIQCENYQLLERIVYYNAPNGGAQFHHDAEKGHVGVVYAQLSGKTFWLALSKAQLIAEIQAFVQNTENCNSLLAEVKQKNLDESFVTKLGNGNFIDQALNELFHPELELLLNFNKAFFAQLVKQGYGYYLQAGDIILLPQESMANCAWHTVFCVGESAGQALSFAIKTFDQF